MKKQAYNVDRDQDKSLTTAAISMNSRSNATLNSLWARRVDGKIKCNLTGHVYRAKAQVEQLVLFHGRPTLSFMRPFRCPVTILNTIDHLGKFDGKADEGTKANDNAGQARKETEHVKNCIILPLWTVDPSFSQNPKSSHDDGSKPLSDDGKKIKEEVYVCKPPGFEDLDFSDRVYKVENAMYGLHQAPRAWYKTLLTCLLDNGFQRGKIDKTLFIKRHKGDILLVQVYVDDIIFGSTKKELCIAFEKLMHEKFQMSSMGEFTFFLGLQVKQKMDGTFISQDIYVAKILKKFRIFKYLRGQPKLGIWYPKDSPFDLVAYTDSDYAGASLDRKFTTGAKKSVRLMMEKLFRMELELMMFWYTAMAKTINGEAHLHAKVDRKKIIVTESSVRRDLRLADEEDEAIHKELGDRLVRAATIASSLEAK
uniref:Ribonuclease H-like domain, reverse transcriptase, RNA-dependent DNA polymerase n=1 Tax=Tanacetum cinerariifolium TaxID=118510 RepID=A0A699I3Y7_TANCI|nr:ribonuclease H-like domain, reverse transcriptase, RNA-dependent DNA polymerase [Tanacetum cinerariifolium]